MSITAECYGNWLEIDMHTAKRQTQRERQRQREQTEYAFNLHYAKRLLVYHRNAVASYCPISLEGNCPQTMWEKNGNDSIKKKPNCIQWNQSTNDSNVLPGKCVKIPCSLILKKIYLPWAKLMAAINGNELKVDNYTLRIRSVGHSL